MVCPAAANNDGTKRSGNRRGKHRGWTASRLFVRDVCTTVGCQNPETWEFAERTGCLPEQILEMVKRNPLIRGVTLSGGEPFSQPEEHAQLAQLLHQNGYEVAAYTGYTFEQLLEGTPQQRHLLENIDVLVDGPFLLEKKDAGASFPAAAATNEF